MSANREALRMMRGREPVELGEGVTPEQVVKLALDVVDLGYRAHGENARASLPAVQVDWMMQQWAEAEAAAERDGSDYADAMDARMEDALAFEKLWEALNRATKAMDGVDVFVTTKERIHRPAGEQWWAEEMAAARAALAEPYKQEPRSGDGWPGGCIKPGSCSRHRQCMYARSVEQCCHFGQDLTQAVEAATRDREWTAADQQKGGAGAA